MIYTTKAIVRRGEQSGYVAECLELPVVTQGTTLDEVTQNLRDAITLHLEGENLEELGFTSNPPSSSVTNWSRCLPRLKRLSGREVVVIFQKIRFFRRRAKRQPCQAGQGLAGR